MWATRRPREYLAGPCEHLAGPRGQLASRASNSRAVRAFRMVVRALCTAGLGAAMHGFERTLILWKWLPTHTLQAGLRPTFWQPRTGSQTPFERKKHKASWRFSQILFTLSISWGNRAADTQRIHGWAQVIRVSAGHPLPVWSSNWLLGRHPRPAGVFGRCGSNFIHQHQVTGFGQAVQFHWQQFGQPAA